MSAAEKAARRRWNSEGGKKEKKRHSEFMKKWHKEHGSPATGYKHTDEAKKRIGAAARARWAARR